MANYTMGADLLRESVNNVNIFGISWILPIVVVVFLTLLITRDSKQWGIIIFPMTILAGILGLKFSFVWWLIVAIWFVITALTTDTLTSVVKTFTTMRERREQKVIKHAKRIRGREKAVKGIERVTTLLTKDLGGNRLSSKGAKEKAKELDRLQKFLRKINR